MFGGETWRRSHRPLGWGRLLPVLAVPLLAGLSGCYGKQALRQPVTVEEIALDVEQIRSDQAELRAEMEQIETQLAQQAELIKDLQAGNESLYEEVGQRLSAIDAQLQDAIARSSGYSSSGEPYWSGSGTLPRDGRDRDAYGDGTGRDEGSGDQVSPFADNSWQQSGGATRSGSDERTPDRSASSPHDEGSRPEHDLERPDVSGIDPASRDYDESSATQDEIQAKRVYDQAYLDYSRGNYSLAILGFAEFLRRSPYSTLADNAQYWIGECYYAQSDFRQARTEYETVVREHPRGDRVPSALLKSGLCALRLERDEEARHAFLELTDRFPDTEESMVARDKLRSMQ